MTAQQTPPNGKPPAKPAAQEYEALYQRAHEESRKVWWHKDDKLPHLWMAESGENLLSRAEAWMDLISKNDAPAFRSEKSQSARRLAAAQRVGEPTDAIPVQDRLVATPVGAYITQIGRLSPLPSLWHYSEKITLLLQAIETLRLTADSFTYRWETVVADGQQAPQRRIVVQRDDAARFDELVAYLRQGMKAPDFKRRLRQRKERATRNQRAGQAYFQALLAKNSRLLVVRIDLFYDLDELGCTARKNQEKDQAFRDVMAAQRSTALEREMTDQERTELEVTLINQERLHLALEWEARERARLEGVLSDRQRLINKLRKNKKLAEHLVGFIWKLEMGEKRGPHYHFTFFFDGQKVQKDDYLGFELGRYWRNTITGGRGRFYNCNACKDDYDYLGIGLIEHGNQEKQQYFLRYVLGYMTKKEQYLKAKLSKQCKTFDHGQLPKPRQSAAGRPRKAPSRHASGDAEPSPGG